MKAKFSRSLTSALGMFLTIPLLLAVSSANGALSLDTSSREKSRVFYNAVYPASENINPAWTGSVAGRRAGTTSPAFRASVLERVNFYRAFAGVPGGIAENTTWSSKDQAAALMMSANNSLSHNPPISWIAYSTIGATAAGKSNLALGTFGTKSIDSYMEDPGSSNKIAGHRRWMLYPQTKLMGTGDIPNGGSNFTSNALWVQDLNLFGPRPAVRDTFVAWPPQGFVPYQLVYPRWSFSYPDADFSNTQVSMKLNGVSIPVAVQPLAQGYGENTIVFVPSNLNPDAWAGPVKPVSDLNYTVTITKVKHAGKEKTFTYSVKSFDPARAGSDTPSFVISGTSAPKLGIFNNYTIAPQVLATGYQWRYSAKAVYTTVAGAEIAGDVLATVPSGYAFRDPKVKATGAYSYHFAHPNFKESSFIIKDALLCSATTSVSFSSQLATATNFQSGNVEVSPDGGITWSNVWTQKGSNSSGESAFTKRTVLLGKFAGKEIKVRFRYALGVGSAFTQTDKGVGWYVDNVAFAGSHRMTGTVLTSTTLPLYPFKPTVKQGYVLQVRPKILGKYYTAWSNAKALTAVQ